jgi:hypothetical protein
VGARASVLTRKGSGLQFSFAVLTAFVSPYLTAQLDFKPWQVDVTWSAGEPRSCRLPALRCSPSLLTRAALGLPRSADCGLSIVGTVVSLCAAWWARKRCAPSDGRRDVSKSPRGRRRPFILVGAILTSISILILGFSKVRPPNDRETDRQTERDREREHDQK